MLSFSVNIDLNIQIAICSSRKIYYMSSEDLSGTYRAQVIWTSEFTDGKSHILKDNIFMIQKRDREQNMGVT